jgi:hypothetical protein
MIRQDSEAELNIMFARFVTREDSRNQGVAFCRSIIRYSIVLLLFWFILQIILFIMDSSCCANPGAKQNHEYQGYEEEVAGVNTYKTGQGKSAIVLFTDIFGYSFINTRKIADRFAEESETTVFIPDYFHGDPVNPNIDNYRELLPDWLKKHPVTEACAIADKFISTIKGHYQSIQVNNRNFLCQCSSFSFR